MFRQYEQILGSSPWHGLPLRSLHTKRENQFPSVQTMFMQVLSTVVRLCERILSFQSLIIRWFSSHMPFIVLECDVFEKPNRVLEWTTICYAKVMTDISFLCYGMVLVFFVQQTMAVFSNVTSFSYFDFVLYQRMQRVRQGAVSSYYRECKEVHLVVYGWPLLANHFRVGPLFFISIICSKYYSYTSFLINIDHRMERRCWVYVGLSGHIAWWE